MPRYFPPLLLALILLALSACRTDPLHDPVVRDFDAIVESDTLTALMMYNSTSYFIYRAEPMGYEYELLRAFARAHGIRLHTRVVNDADSLLYLLNAGVGDVAAARLVPEGYEGHPVHFTQAVYTTQPAVVQRTGPLDVPESVAEVLAEGAEAADTDLGAVGPSQDLLLDDLPERMELQARRVQAPQDLEGETVVIDPGSPHRHVLVELSEELTGDVYVVEVAGTTQESLIRAVAYDRVELTVTSEHLAQLQTSQFTNVEVHPTLGEPQDIAWAVRPNAPQLREALDTWLAQPEQDQLRQRLFQRYFIDRRGYRERIESEYLSSVTGRLSQYDELFKRHAGEIGWDWRLLASQSYQESKFNPTIVSWAGAQGLMQIMPPTAREFGVTNVNDPEQNVAGAVRFIRWLQNYWEDRIPDPQERMKFVLASYNTGHGHVQDARRLTERANADDTVWSDVAYWLLQKSDPAIYRLPEVRYGFSRGLEPVTYVQIILERYNHYRQFVDPDDHAPSLEAMAETEPEGRRQPLERVGGVR